MQSLLDKNVVLVLNRNWQAIDVKTPQSAFGMMACGAARGLDIHRQDDEQAGNRPTFDIQPVTWEDWVRLPVRSTDCFVQTVRGKIRIPTVIVVGSFNKVPLVKPRLSLRTLWQRDGGVCQYTGRPLERGEGSIDHVMPVSRGGNTSWENCVLADRKVNNRKGSRLPEEAGLRLRSMPRAPKAVPVTATLHNTEEIDDWKIFLIR